MDVTTKVKKPVEAIQCANTFSLLQRKMYNVLLANASANLCREVTHRIATKTLCKLMGYRSNDYKTIKQKFRELRRMDIEWDIINEKGNKVWTNTSPLSLARVIEGEGICEYEFTPSLVPFLDRPAQYAKFSLIVQAKFKSGYGLALYENCERYRNIGYTKSFDVPTFRKLMGVGDAEYLEFFALKRRVITIALKEVNQHADFNIEAEYEKRGRSIIAIRFIIKNKQTAFLTISPLLNSFDEEDQIINKLKDYFGLSQKDINKYLKKYGRQHIEEKIGTILNSDSFRNGLIKNMGGYLKVALSGDFQVDVSSKMIIARQKQEQEVMLNTQRQQREKLNQFKKAHHNYLLKEICQLMPKMSKNIKNKIMLAFEQYLGSGGFLDLFRKEGLNNILIADRFIEFAKVKHPEILEMAMSFEEYLGKLSETGV